MNRRLVLFVIVVMVVLGLARVLFHGRRTLQLSHAVAASVQARNEGEPKPSLESWLRGRPLNLLGCEKDPVVCGRFRNLLSTMLIDHQGRLPDGLQAGTWGPIDWKTADSWLNAATVVFADRAQVDELLCLNTLELSTFLARHGGADGERIASRLMLLALPECARIRAHSNFLAFTQKERDWFVQAMGPMLSGFALDGQLRRFGSWLTPEDLASLPPGMRALAATAPPPPFNPLERNARAAIWSRAHDYQEKFATGAFEIDTAVKEWPERVSDPKRLRQAYDEERVRVAAVELVLDAWNMKQNCELGTGATSSVKPDGEDCLLTNQNLHVQLPSRKE